MAKSATRKRTSQRRRKTLKGGFWWGAAAETPSTPTDADIKTEEQILAKMRADQAEAARTTGAQVNSDIRNEPHTPPPIPVGGRRRRKRSSKKATKSKKSKKSKKSRKSKKRTGRRRRH